MEDLVKNDIGILNTTLVNIGRKQVRMDTCYNKKDFPETIIYEEDIKNPKLKVGVGLLHYNNTAYPFRVHKVNYDKRTLEMFAYGNNFVETVDIKPTEVSFDIINKEFEIFNFPVEHEL